VWKKTGSYNRTTDRVSRQPFTCYTFFNTSRNTLYHVLQSTENYTFVCRSSLDSVCTSTTPIRLTQKHVLGNKHSTKISQSWQMVHWLAIELDTFLTRVRRSHKSVRYAQVGNRTTNAAPSVRDSTSFSLILVFELQTFKQNTAGFQIYCVPLVDCHISIHHFNSTIRNSMSLHLVIKHSNYELWILYIRYSSNRYYLMQNIEPFCEGEPKRSKQPNLNTLRNKVEFTWGYWVLI
jgi:hypothetical protein